MSRYGASQFSSLFDKCVLWWPGSHIAATNTAKTITANGNVTQVTTIPDPWGMSRPVAYFDGSGDYLTVPDSNDWYFGTGDYCIECFIKTSAHGASNGTLFYQGDSVANTSTVSMLICVVNGKIKYYPDYSNSGTPIVSTITVTDNTWHHIACVRNGNVFTIYIDGVADGSKTVSWTAINTAYPLSIGEIGTSYFPYNGYISELRISKGIARYTSNFTPSTTRFKPDIYTKLLLHMYGSGATFVDDPYVDIDEFPIIPSGVTVTPTGTFTKTDLGNNKGVVS